MNNNKEEKGLWNSRIIIALLLVVVVAVLLFNNYGHTAPSGTDENIKIGNGTGNQIGNSANAQIGNDANNTVVPMSSDEFFKTWIGASFKTIDENLNCISKASKVKNLAAVGACAKLLNDNSNISLRDIDRHGANTSLKAVSIEYKRALEDYHTGGMELEVGANSGNASQVVDAIEYIKNGTIHVKLVGKMLEESNTTSENFVSPKEGDNATGQ